MAQGYKFKNDRYKQCLRPERHLAGGAGIVSTVNDLAKFDIALHHGRLASADVTQRLFKPGTSPDGIKLPYAFGWYVQEYKDEKLVWHAGWDEEAGFTALYLKIPERQLTLILLANSEGMYWGNPLNRAEVESSVFARQFLNHFIFKRP